MKAYFIIMVTLVIVGSVYFLNVSQPARTQLDMIYQEATK